MSAHPHPTPHDAPTATTPDHAAGLERLLATVAEAGTILLGAGSLDTLVPRVLSLLGEGLDVDRAYLCEYHLDEQTAAPVSTQRYAWQRPQPGAPDHPVDKPCEPLSNDLYKRLSAGRAYSGLVRDIPPAQRAALEQRGVRSLIVVPVLLRGSFWGFAGFEDHHTDRVWTATEESLLFTLTGSLGTALAGRIIEQQLLARDSLLRGVALSTQELLATPDFDTGLPRALAALGEAAQVDRVYIFENIIGPGGVDRRLCGRYVWSRGQTPAEGALRYLQNLNYDELFPRWFEILSAGRPISGRVLDFFARTQGENGPQLRSILLVPINSENRFWGIVGFDDHDVNRIWAAGDEAILKAMAGGLGGAIARKQAEGALRASEEHFRTLIENASDLIAILDDYGNILYLSPSSERTLGYTPAELKGYPAVDLLHPDDLKSLQPLREVMLTQPEAIRTVEFRLRRRDGAWRMFEGVAKVNWQNQTRRFVVNARDITERRKAEVALRQSTDLLRHSQKMEAVGRLAGGVAHDFNNLLTAIMGYGDILQDRLPANHPMRHEVEEICKAADRAHALTRQLLAFSRKQVLEPKVINLNTVVQEVKKLLARLIGEHIELDTELSRDLGTVRVDPGQMEQVLINLVVNARDAMPEGGRITLSTGNVELGQPLSRGHLTVGPGHYVALSVSDTGHGMDEEVQAHLFEPFFTTKEVGKGTGLGLSMVYGIIEQSGGHILFDTSPGRGTTFTLYFPRLEGTAQTPAAGADRTSRGGHETILLVEDEEMVRDLAARILRERGYQVLVARSGAEALRLLEEHPGGVDLLLTDIVMPQLSGQALARQVAAKWPRTRVLFMSGYAQESAQALDALSLERNYLQKPFPPADLARKLREVLDAP